MTNQLQDQYLDDFEDMITEIKGRDNYPCNYGGSCKPCSIQESYNKLLHDWRQSSQKENKPKRPPKCKDCPYKIALDNALASKCIITNYDYLYTAGNYAKTLPPRDLIIFDESHNFENKLMQLTTVTLNRKNIWKKYDFDIFDGIENGLTLKEVQSPNYWINVCRELVKQIKFKLDNYIRETYGELGNIGIGDTLFDENMISFENSIVKYENLIQTLKNKEWIIETPTKKQIISDNNLDNKLKVEFKPLTVEKYSDHLTSFGDTRLFMTGTLGDKDRFCQWLGLDPVETYYIHIKSPFPINNRRIKREYVGSMSGTNNKLPNWKNFKALYKINEILLNHSGEKGVIHTSSNEQAWWIKDNLITNRRIYIAQGKNRAKTIKCYEDSYDGLLVGAGIKDGVDFKHDKCRFQIIFKIPYPSLAGAQVNIRKRYDIVWYMHQTIMPLMQAYGRGIRDMTDYCSTYVLDNDLDTLLDQYGYLFNEYFLEAIDGEVMIKPHIKRVNVKGGK